MMLCRDKDDDIVVLFLLGLGTNTILRISMYEGDGNLGNNDDNLCISVAMLWCWLSCVTDNFFGMQDLLDHSGNFRL